VSSADDNTFSEGWLWNFKEPAAKTDIKIDCSSYYLFSPSTGAEMKNYINFGQYRYCLIILSIW
jgi:Pyruvate/2-oxoacid:ferredoxin oxidoreductase delta subunit